MKQMTKRKTELNRRDFLLTAVAASVGAVLSGCAMMAEVKNPLRVYVAVGTAGAGSVPGKGIYAATFDVATGMFGAAEMVADTINPMYIGVSPDKRFLYSGMAAPLVAGGNQSQVIAYAIDGVGLKKLNAVNAEGINSRWPTVDRAAHNLLYINYETGQIMVRRLSRDGQIGEVTSAVGHTGKGIVMPRQEKPHPHAIRLSANERYAVVTDLGIDQYLVYKFDGAAGSLTRHAAIATAPGAGPRHFVFHPNGKFVYGANELNSTVNALSWNDATGELKVMQTLSALPAGFNAQNISGDILIHPNGKFLYVTNRGHDSIAIFSINAQSGELTLKEHAPAPGKFPWALALDPSNRWLLVANQRSDSVTALLIDAAAGTLAKSGHEVMIPNPAWLVFA